MRNESFMQSDLISSYLFFSSTVSPVLSQMTGDTVLFFFDLSSRHVGSAAQAGTAVGRGCEEGAAGHVFSFYLMGMPLVMVILVSFTPFFVTA